MPHGGINRGGGELLLPPSNTRTTVAGAALAATGAVPKVYTAVAGASSSGPPSLITDIHEGLRASDFQTMDTDIHEGLRTDFEKLTLKENEWQHNLKELAENTFSVGTPAVAGPGGMPAVAVPGAPLVGGPCKTAVAGHGMPLPAMLQASIILLASVRGEGAAAHGMVMHQAEVATRQGCDTHVFYFTALYSVVVVFLTVFVTRVLVERGWLWTATLTAPPASRTCSKATQSQVTYTYVSNPLRSEFRFAPLPERDQGCWLVA